MAGRKQKKDSGKAFRQRLAKSNKTSGGRKAVVEEGAEKEAHEHEATSEEDTDTDMEGNKVQPYMRFW
jgi:hypothetical protein